MEYSFNRAILDHFHYDPMKSITDENWGANYIACYSTAYDEIGYAENLNFFKKRYGTGTYTIRTSTKGICSYFFVDKETKAMGGIINVPPYSMITVEVDSDYDWYVYESGIVYIYQRKLDNIPAKFDTLFQIAFYIFFFAPPIIIGVIASLVLEEKIANIIFGILCPTWIFIVLLIIDAKRTKKKRLLRKRMMFFDGLNFDKTYK